jgi:hypothetical protein
MEAPMDPVTQLAKIKSDPHYIKLKNKARTNQEGFEFQKYLRAIKALEVQIPASKNFAHSNLAAHHASLQPKHKPAPITPKSTYVKKPAWRNQKKEIAWRNQTTHAAAHNDDVRDEEYERAYALRMANLALNGEFNLGEATIPHTDHRDFETQNPHEPQPDSEPEHEPEHTPEPEPTPRTLTPEREPTPEPEQEIKPTPEPVPVYVAPAHVPKRTPVKKTPTKRVPAKAVKTAAPKVDAPKVAVKKVVPKKVVGKPIEDFSDDEDVSKITDNFIQESEDDSIGDIEEGDTDLMP